MITKKFLASAVATIATAGMIGVAIAQSANPTPSNSKDTTTTGAMPGTGGPNSTASNTGTTAGGTDSTTGNSGGTTMTTQSSGAGSTVSAEAAPKADRN